MAQDNKAQSEIRYLNPVSVDVKKKKYCRFKKLGIKYVDYKDGEFLKKFLNEQGKILPRRLTGTSQKALAETIANLPLSLSVKAEEGKLFGTVTATDLAEALAAKGITVDRKQISVEAVKTVGEFEATVRLHKEVKATIKFSVSAAE